MSDATTIRVFRVDAAEFARLARLAGVTSPEMFHTLIVKSQGMVVAKFEKEEK
jgi:hypothetical protein